MIQEHTSNLKIYIMKVNPYRFVPLTPWHMPDNSRSLHNPQFFWCFLLTALAVSDLNVRAAHLDFSQQFS